MILTCPSCSTRYFTADSSIGPNGRTVRCASCSQEWFAEPQLVLDAAAKPEPLTRARVERMRRDADQPGPAPSAAARYRQQQADRMRRERTRAAIAAWGVTGAALAASAAGAIVFRQDVAELWPRSASAFAAVGLEVNVYGLEFNDLAVERAFEGPTPILLISGEVRNVGHDAKASPPIRITLRDSQSKALYEVVHRADPGAIAAGAASPFHIRVENPPAEAVDLEAAFASPREAAEHAEPPEPPPLPVVTADPSLDAPVADGEGIDETGHSTAEPHAGDDGLAPRFAAEPVMHGG